MPTVLDSLNQALHLAFTRDPRVFLLGEDILDPYGGAFKVTSGLSSSFPGRVLSTPVSEAAITGVAAGMALRGLRPVVEIMFGDFLTLAADQIINHLAKLRWIYNDQVRLPVVIRAPMGGRRGYGPTHSQTLEKHFLGVPGLRLLAPCGFGDPGALLVKAILEDDDPVVFVENKLLYLLPMQDAQALPDFQIDIQAAQSPNSYAPTIILSLRGAPPPVLTMSAYGYMADLARQAIHRLAFEHEVFVELVTPTQLAPFELEPILASAGRSRRLLVIEEGTFSLGWGAEVLAQATEAHGNHLLSACRLAARDLPVPASPPLEAVVLPDVEDIVEQTLGMVR